MGILKAGAGKACINPPAEWFPLESFMNAEVAGVNHDLFTRAVVINNGVQSFIFINLDCGPSPDIQMKNDISARYGIPVDNIIGVWTHNHSFAMKWGRDPALPERVHYTDVIYKAVYSAIDDAMASLRPAHYGYGEGKSYINVNRNKRGEDGHWMQTANFEGPSDKTLAVMKLVDDDGTLIGAILNYGCHATTAFQAPDFDGKIRANGGFPGYAADYMENRYKGSVVLWTSGAAGDQDPIASYGFPQRFLPDGTAEDIELPNGSRYIIQKYFGELHAIDAIRAVESITEYKNSMDIKTVSTHLTLPGHRPPDGVDRVKASFITVNNTYRNAHPDEIVGGKKLSEIDRIEMIKEGTSSMHMQVAVLGDIAWVGVSGEPYCEIGMKMKAASPYKNTVIVTHTEGDALANGGYIISDSAAEQDTFQYFHTETCPGGNDDRLTNGMLELFEKLN